MINQILKKYCDSYKHFLDNCSYCYFLQGDLGAIDDKYDVAISTACGALDNIVCDSIDTAQKCITFLKHNNIGSGTFIGLDKVQQFQFLNCLCNLMPLMSGLKTYCKLCSC